MGAKPIPVSVVLLACNGLLVVLLLSMWASLSARVAGMPGRVLGDGALNKRLETLEQGLAGLREAAGDTREQQARTALAQAAVHRRREALPGQKRLQISLSTMRRGVAREHVYETLDSLIPFLGSDGALHAAVTVVDVERGEGLFAAEVAAKYGELVRSGLLTVRHLDDAARTLLYGDLVRTCDLPRLYGDDLTRTIWRSKRVLDFVYSVRLASLSAPDYVLVLEDDTPVLGSLHAGATQCIAMFGNSTTACRWDFHWEKRVGLTKVFPVEHEVSRALVLLLVSHTFALQLSGRAAKIMYPQGNLQGLFAMMLPTADWLVLCDYMRANFAHAPADWLAGRWLFQQNWRIAFMPPVMGVYHCTGSNFGDSSRLAVARSLSSDPFFAGKPLEWARCDRAAAAAHPFKWEEDAASFRLRWVGGDCLFLELPWTDIEGHDVGVPRDAALMDQDARLIVCQMTPACRAMNVNGWMKGGLLLEAVSQPEKSKKLLLRVPLAATPTELAAIRAFFLACVARLPQGRLPKTVT